VKPLLPKHYRVRVEDGGDGGRLVFTSENRRVFIAGQSLGLFAERVLPLLDGRRTLAEIQDLVAADFGASAVERAVSLLERHRIVEDAERAAIPPEVHERLEPEINYFREVSPDPARAVDRLADATVAIVGLGAFGAVAAAALAAANVGHLLLVDGAAVSPSDPFLAQIFGLDDVGRPRTDVIRDRIRALNPAAAVEAIAGGLSSEDEVATVVRGADFVLGCLDPGLSSITLMLNRACLAQRISWTSGRVSAFDGIVGPTVIPYETACYLCYEQRAVACNEDSPGTLAELAQFREMRTDTSRHRENLAFGAGIVGHLLALEAFRTLIAERPPRAGRILTVDFATSLTKEHLVLRKPWCPACGEPDDV
jgi:bacteriocin biosynthesis cyclodehydratase domain-containing protein